MRGKLQTRHTGRTREWGYLIMCNEDQVEVSNLPAQGIALHIHLVFRVPLTYCFAVHRAKFRNIEETEMAKQSSLTERSDP